MKKKEEEEEEEKKKSKGEGEEIERLWKNIRILYDF
jgi:hypothetical protein